MYQLGAIAYDGLVGPGEDVMSAGIALMRVVAETDAVGTGEVTAATVEPIPAEAAPLLELVTSAQYNIGKAYLEGFGVVQDVSAGEAWWLKSARFVYALCGGGRAAAAIGRD
jgi:hypothetical protein